MKFIVISGADACGKDTQIDKLEQFFIRQGLNTQVLSIHSSLADFTSVTNPKTLSDVLNVFLLKFEPIARTLFLQSLIKNALSKIHINTQIVIFNGYWYKYAASEAAYGVPLSFWNQSADIYFPKPDIAVHLDVPFEACSHRRQVWTPYEGGQARYWGIAPLSFEQFQRSMHKQFQTLFATTNAPVLHIDGNHDSEQVTRNIVSIFDDSPMPKSTELFI
jgi:thymidylate kinase